METMKKDGSSQKNSIAILRWSPTKEQINMLEGLYKEGIRTPSSEQIQQITSKLKVYGHVEGKNVFYWFQNHKARQRQKQKQETTNLPYLSNCKGRFLHNPSFITSSHPVFIPPPPSPPLPPTPYNNVICSQSYVPASHTNIGYYYQYPVNKLPLPPAGVVQKKSSRTGLMMMNERELESSGANANNNIHGMMQQDVFPSKTSTTGSETLALFPLHPTGVLDEDNNHHQSNEDSIPCSSPYAAERNHDQAKPFFDFFGEQQQQQH